MIGEDPQHGGLGLGDSASLNRVFWKSLTGWPKALRSLRVGERLVEAPRMPSAAPMRDESRSCGSSLHQVGEALALLAEQVGDRHPHVVEEQLGGVLRVLADLVELAAARKPARVALDHDQAECPCAPGAGSVLQTTMHQAGMWPLVMKVLLPLMT